MVGSRWHPDILVYT